MESEAKVQTLAQHGQGITQAVYPQSGQGTQFKLRPPLRTKEVQSLPEQCKNTFNNLQSTNKVIVHTYLST